MAITRATLRLLRQLATQVGELADDAVRTLTAAWIDAWDELTPAWRQAIADALDLAARTGRWPAPWQLARIERLTAAVDATERALAVLAAQAGVSASGAAATAVTATAAAQPQIIASQFPVSLVADAAAAVAGNILPTPLDVIVQRTTERITSATRPLSAEAMTAVNRALVYGVAVGDNPNQVGRDMLRRVEGAFNGGLTRAITIARTEILDAHRAVAAYAHDANADVLDGWTWLSALQPNTCPACWAMHGTTHPLSTPGPLDHQAGRCTRVPKVKSWRDLGVDLDEPDDATPDAETQFRKLSRTQQAAVMGPARLALLNSGAISWADLAIRRDNPGWRPSYAPRPVRELRRIAARRRSAA